MEVYDDFGHANAKPPLETRATHVEPKFQSISETFYLEPLNPNVKLLWEPLNLHLDSGSFYMWNLSVHNLTWNFYINASMSKNACIVSTYALTATVRKVKRKKKKVRPWKSHT